MRPAQQLIMAFSQGYPGFFQQGDRHLRQSAGFLQGDFQPPVTIHRVDRKWYGRSGFGHGSELSLSLHYGFVAVITIVQKACHAHYGRGADICFGGNFPVWDLFHQHLRNAPAVD